MIDSKFFMFKSKGTKENDKRGTSGNVTVY